MLDLYPARLQVRLYRVRSLFQFLEYNLSFSLLNVTIVRNLAVSSRTDQGGWGGPAAPVPRARPLPPRPPARPPSSHGESI